MRPNNVTAMCIKIRLEKIKQMQQYADFPT